MGVFVERHLGVEVRDVDVRDVEDLEGFYTERSGRPAVGIEQTLCNERREALILEAESILSTRVMRWDEREFFFTPKSYETMCRRRVENLKRTIEETRPDWVEAVRDAAGISNDLCVIIAFADLCHSPYPAVAIIENLVERGEIGHDTGGEGAFLSWA